MSSMSARVKAELMSTAWTESATKWVSQWQERAWGDLSVEMGFDWAPRRAYEALSPPPVPDDYLTVDRVRSQTHAHLPEDSDWASASQAMSDYKARYLVGPPTEYESPILSGTLRFHLDTVLTAMSATSLELPYRPIIATMPLGDVNARIRKIPSSDDAVILFQQGIVEFLDQMAIVLASAIPFYAFNLTFKNPSRANTELAVEQLTDTLIAYAVHGNPYRATRRHLSGSSMTVATLLASAMRTFLVSHEVMHIILGHLTKSRDPEVQSAVLWDRELGADEAAAPLVATCGPEEGQLLRWWACDAALWCFQMLERTIWHLQTGQLRELPATVSHPRPYFRRERLLDRSTELLWDANQQQESNSLGELAVLSNTVGEQLWNATMPTWSLLRQRSVKPAEIWHRRLNVALEGDKK